MSIIVLQPEPAEQLRDSADEIRVLIAELELVVREANGILARSREVLVNLEKARLQNDGAATSERLNDQRALPRNQFQL